MRREERSDTELVLAARGDDPEAFGLLFDRWFGNAWNVARTIVRQDDLAADVAQDALLAAWQGLDGLRDPDAFGGWVLRITRNRALNRLSRERRSTASGDDVVSGLKDRGLDDPGGAERPPAPDAASEIRDRQELVWAAAAALGERDVSLLDLHLRHGLTPAEIAEETGVEANAAHQQLFRLRAKLGDAIGSYLLWRNGRPLCDGLAEAVSGQKAFNRSVARAVARHQTSCEHCSEERAALVDPAKLFAAVPLVLVPSQLKVQAAAALQSAGVPMGGAGGGTASGGRSFDDGGTGGGSSSGPGPDGGLTGGSAGGGPGGEPSGLPGGAPGGPSPGVPGGAAAPPSPSPPTPVPAGGPAAGAGPADGPLLGDAGAQHATAAHGYGPAAAMADHSDSLLSRLEGLPRPKVLTVVGSAVLLLLAGLALRSVLADGGGDLAAIDSSGGQALVAGADDEGSESEGDQGAGGPSADLSPSGPTASAEGSGVAGPTATDPGDQPSDPPTDQVDPTDPPSDPVDPTDPPTGPTDPVDPTEPTVPPTDPTDPTDPPTDPTDPTDPPTDPTDPTDPPTDPTDPTDPPTDPTDPPTDPTDPPREPEPPKITGLDAGRLPRDSLGCTARKLIPYDATWSTENAESVSLAVPGAKPFKGRPNGGHQFCASRTDTIVLTASGPGGTADRSAKLS